MKSKSNEIKDKFNSLAKDCFKVVHWDGKVIEYLTANGGVYEDANAVVLSSPVVFSLHFSELPLYSVLPVGSYLKTLLMCFINVDCLAEKLQ